MNRESAETVLVYADHEKKVVGGITLARNGWPVATLLGDKCGIESIRPYRFEDGREVLGIVPYRSRMGDARRLSKHLNGYRRTSLLRRTTT